MFGKVMVRNSFTNVVKYVLNKEKDAGIIASDGVLTDSVQSIISMFEAQASMRPSLGKKVGHIALSFSPNDSDKCNNKFMADIAKEYMKEMGIDDTQYIIARHNDHEHPHIHIVYNRVNNEGKTISDRNQHIKNRKVCRDLTFRHDLYYALRRKENVNRDRLRQPAKSKYIIYDAINAFYRDCRSWNELGEKLKEDDITFEFVFKGKTNEVQGVVFMLNGYRFTGSKIDRRFSYSKLNTRFRFNYEHTCTGRQTNECGDRAVNPIPIMDIKHPYRPIRNPLAPTPPSCSVNNENEISHEIDKDDLDYIYKVKHGYFR